MANILIASNASGIEGKWRPYYYKTFLLGTQGVAGSSTDGETYITTSASSDVAIEAECTDVHNCGYYYTLTFASGSPDTFKVIKYTLDDTLVETIAGTSTTGDGVSWDTGNTFSITIDIGVNVFLASNSGFDSTDIYKIELPSAEKMERRRIYHGGYSAFIRMPNTEAKANHSDIIPFNLSDKNVSFFLNNVVGMGNNYLKSATSKASGGGNQSITTFLEWNIDKDGATSTTAGGDDYSWGSGETWTWGSTFQNDLSPSATTDMPFYENFPSSDVTASSNTTGVTQDQNFEVAGRGGYARVNYSFTEGAGSGEILCHNQFWQTIIMLS